MSASAIYLALLIGMLASGFHVVFKRARLSDGVIYASLIGGTLGGLVAAFLIGPAETLTRNDILLIALCGYVGAGALIAWVRPTRKRA